MTVDPSICQCGGTGYVERDGKVFECECAFLRRRFADMPRYIRTADVKDAHVQQIPIRSVGKSLYIISSWPDMMAIIKLVMIRYRNLFLKITSDREILDVYLGKAARLAKAAESRYSRGEDDVGGNHYNSVQELMDPPGLCIVRLNEILYKNKAAPSVLEEALSYRLDRDKPTWILSNVDRQFQEGSVAYSDSVNYFIHSSMQTVCIPRIIPRVLMNSPLTLDHVEIDASPVDSTPAPAPAPKKKTVKIQDELEQNPLSQYGSGLGKKKTFRSH